MTEGDRSGGPRRGGPLPRRSAKRRARDRAEAVLKRELLARDGGCVMRADQGREVADGRPSVLLVPRCSGPLDKHETVPRSLWPAGALEPTNCVILCRRHHDWLEEGVRTRLYGRARGLLRGSADAPPPGYAPT